MRTVDTHELDIRPLRETRVSLEQRAEPEQVPTFRFSPDDGVRIADRNRRELDLLAVDVN
jgi:hypothetical protein